jgi:hypothetical protein
VNMRQILCLMLAGWWIVIEITSFAAEVSGTDSVEPMISTGQAIVQIFGRTCEYHREDVEVALRAFMPVRQVEFLNHHGTVLVRYQPGRETPEQLANAVHRPLAGGWNCSERVDRGESDR